jgi:hypothetical protein
MAMLFTVKTVLRRLIDLLPLNVVPDPNPTSKEGILFDKTMREIIQNAELNHPDPENFIVFAETLRKVILFLMETDGYYRRYATAFFDKVSREWKCSESF